MVTLKTYRDEKFKSDEAYWENNWSDTNIANLSISGVTEFEELPILLNHVKKEHRILDAGCGLGQFVYYLGECGYMIDGLDFSLSLLRKAKGFDGQKSYINGDVNHLPFKNKSYDIVLSFGVLEHLGEGLEKSLRETNRILKEDGLLFLDVPYLNFIRKGLFPILKAKEHYNKAYGMQFNQYVFSKKEIEKLVTSSGFKIIEVRKIYPFTMIRNNQFLNKLRMILVKMLGRGEERLSPEVQRVDCSGNNLWKRDFGFKTVIRTGLKRVVNHITPHFILLICARE